MRTTLLLVVLATRAWAACECGYSINDTNSPSYTVFTELIETDFMHLEKIGGDYGWQPQQYNVTAKDARGPFGKQADTRNVVPNPLQKPDGWLGPGLDENDAGLQLWVRAKSSNGLIGMGEADGMRDDMVYGSYRIGMKLSSVNGTCGAFFWYRNDSQEIDIELLSRQFSTNNSTVNLVLQSPGSDAQGFNAANTPYYQAPTLSFDPSAAFHEYRFDWTPGSVLFYIDGSLRSTISTGNLPYGSPGHIIINHWSNGDDNWSGGPPTEDAVATIMYVKTYFNSSNGARKSYRKYCPSYDASKVCQIPDQLVPPTTAGNKPPTFFFSMNDTLIPGQDTGNNTWGDGGEHNGGEPGRRGLRPWEIVIIVTCGVMAFCMIVAVRKLYKMEKKTMAAMESGDGH